MRTDDKTFSTLHGYFSWDHQRLDEVLAEVESELGHGDSKRAERAFHHFERGLRRHIRIEEEIVLQEFASDGAGIGEAREILAEHAEILRRLDEMHATLEGEELARFGALREKLATQLTEHHAKEEEVLYPLLDSLLGAPEAEKLVERLRAE